MATRLIDPAVARFRRGRSESYSVSTADWRGTETTAGTTISRVADGSYAVIADGHPFTISNRDFNVLSFRSNLVFRWEWTAGSTLYVVWQQNRRASETTGDVVRVGDLLNTTHAGGDNFFALKLSYWLPLAGRE